MEKYFFILGVLVFFSIYSGHHFLNFWKKTKEFNRPRTKQEKIDLMLNKIQPRVIFDGYREIKNEEDSYYSSLVLDYQLAEMFGRKAADPNLTFKELIDPEKNKVLANRTLMIQIESEVKEELGVEIQEIISKMSL